MPSGEVDKPVIDDNHDGTVSIRYEPKEEGIHELAVKYNGEHVQGSPFKFHVDSISSGYVTAYGPGLVHGVTGEPAQFIISTKGAGAGGLQMAVEGPSKADVSIFVHSSHSLPFHRIIFAHLLIFFPSVSVSPCADYLP